MQTYRVQHRVEIDILDDKGDEWVDLASCCYQSVVVLEPKDLPTYLYSSSDDINYEASKLLENHIKRSEDPEKE